MKVLIIRSSALGDLLLLTGPLQALKKHKPDLEIHLLTSELGAELFAGHPNVDQCHIFHDQAGLIKNIAAFRKLPSFSFIFDLQAKPKTLLSRLFLKGQHFVIDKQSRARRRFVKKRAEAHKLDAHRVISYWRCLQKAWPELETRDLEDLRPHFYIKPLIEEVESRFLGQAIVIHPYASQNNKQWPHFKKFIEALDHQGTKVMVIGQSAKPLSLKLEHGQDLTNRTTVREMLAVINSGHALVSTDSGPMHAGVAFNKPTLALFGPTTHHLGFAPLFKNCVIVENSQLNCRPCHVHGGNHCPLEHHRCMEDISVQQVKGALNQLLRVASPQGHNPG